VSFEIAPLVLLVSCLRPLPFASTAVVDPDKARERVVETARGVRFKNKIQAIRGKPKQGGLKFARNGHVGCRLFAKPHGKSPFQHLETGAREITHKQQRLSAEGRIYPALNIGKADFRDAFHKSAPPPSLLPFLPPNTQLHILCGMVTCHVSVFVGMSAERPSILAFEPHRSSALREMAVSPKTFSHGVIGNSMMQVFWKEAEEWQKRWFVQSLCEKEKLQGVASSYRGASFIFTLLKKHCDAEADGLRTGSVGPIGGLNGDLHQLLDSVMDCHGLLEQSASGRRLVQRVVQECMAPSRQLYEKVNAPFVVLCYVTFYWCATFTIPSFRLPVLPDFDRMKNA
jgi:hypothetical protein